MINALKYVEELEKAGFSHEQAETSVRIFFEVMDQNFATKADLRISLKELEHRMDLRFSDLERRIDIRFAEVGSGFKEVGSGFKEVGSRFRDVDSKFREVDSKFRDLENRLTIKVGAMQAASVGLIVALLKVL